MRRIGVVGASLAGVAAAEELRNRGFDGELVLIGDEPTVPYDRPPLSKGFLAGSTELRDCALRPEGWAEGLNVQLELGNRAVELDAHRRAVKLENGVSIRFDGLVIATGAAAVDIPRSPLEGVHTLRTLDDALAIRAELASASRLVIVGGGFVGAEVAATARGRGVPVTLVDVVLAPLSRVLGNVIGNVFAQLHADHGVDLRFGNAVTAIEGKNRVQRVRLADDSSIETDLVVVGIGVRPCTEWLTSSGLSIEDGVLCDSCCRTSAPGIVAAGDVARWVHPKLGSIRLEHWENAVSQGHAAAQSLLEPQKAQAFAPVPYVWSDQYDRKVQIVGRPAPGDKVVVVDGRLDDPRFVALYTRDGNVTAGLGMNRPGAIRRIRRILATSTSLETVVNELQDAKRSESSETRWGQPQLRKLLKKED